jgi:hypothetical protein
MKIFLLGSYSVLTAIFAVFNGGCYEHPRGPGAGIGTGVEVHDDHWRQNHDHNDDAGNNQDPIDR